LAQPALLGGAAAPAALRYSPQSGQDDDIHFPTGMGDVMHLVLVFTVAVGLYVLGMIVLALAAISGRVRGNRELKKLEPELR
jgi:hypothetical protein